MSTHPPEAGACSRSGWSFSRGPGLAAAGHFLAPSHRCVSMHGWVDTQLPRLRLLWHMCHRARALSWVGGTFLPLCLFDLCSWSKIPLHAGGFADSLKHGRAVLVVEKSGNWRRSLQRRRVPAHLRSVSLRERQLASCLGLCLSAGLSPSSPLGSCSGLHWAALGPLLSGSPCNFSKLLGSCRCGLIPSTPSSQGRPLQAEPAVASEYYLCGRIRATGREWARAGLALRRERGGGVWVGRCTPVCCAELV